MLVAMLGVKRATMEDLEQLLKIAAARRAVYAEYQPNHAAQHHRLTTRTRVSSSSRMEVK